VFNAQHAAFGNGHVGWAFLEPGHGDHWFYGSTDDNAAGDSHVDPGKFNGAYEHDTQGFAGVRQAFKTNSVGYGRFTCKNTPTSAVGGAVQAGRDAAKWGYDVLGNNCEDHMIKILDTYRGDALPQKRNLDDGIPNLYFEERLTPSNGWDRVTNL
jgi:hypothetical protein